MLNPAILRRRRRAGGADPLAAYTYNGFIADIVIDFDANYFYAGGAETTEAALLKTGDRTSFSLDNATMPDLSGKELTVVATGVMDIVGTANPEVRFFRYLSGGSTNQNIYINNGSSSGTVTGFQSNTVQSYTTKSGVIAGTPATDEPFGVAITFNDTGARGSWNGEVGFTNQDNTSAFPDNSIADPLFGDTGTLTFSKVLIFAADIGTEGRQSASPFPA